MTTPRWATAAGASQMLLSPFRVNGQPHLMLIVFYVVLNGVVLVNALLHSPMCGTMQAHTSNTSRRWRRVTCRPRRNHRVLLTPTRLPGAGATRHHGPTVSDTSQSSRNSST